MISRGDDGELAAAGALALAASLNALRRMTNAGRQDSMAELLSTAVNALTQHQDIDGCLVFIGDGDGDDSEAGSPSAQRAAAHMPAFLDAVVSLEVIPWIMEEGSAFFEARLGRRNPDWHGGLLGVPVSDGSRAIGGLIVWNREAGVLMPWHQNLLEMLAAVFLLARERIIAADDNEREKHAGFESPAAASSAHALHRGPIDTLPAIDHAGRLDERRAFELGLEELAKRPISGRRERFLLYIDIDRFRLIREYGGEMTAERMIRVFYDLLRREMAGEKLIAHLGTDSFAVVIERRSLAHAVQLAESFVVAVDSLRLSFHGQRYDVSISIGVAKLMRASDSGQASLRHAMQACKTVQKRGGGAVLTYQDSLGLRRRSPSEGRLLNRLTRALKDDALEIYAQPIAPLEGIGTSPDIPSLMHELLVRMRGDDGGLINAGAFIPLAERYGLSVKLDRWVIQHAFRHIAAAGSASDPTHRFTLNLSGHSIDDQSLLGFIVEQLEESGLPPERICFEITETAAISDIAAAIKFVEDLKQLGCEFALDDFGSGHSSFLYLRDLPIDYLKIDGELVREIADDPVSLSFVRTIEGVARLMGRRTIAESVESEAIRDAIAEIGCNYVQGYLVGVPVPLSEVLASLE